MVLQASWACLAIRSVSEGQNVFINATPVGFAKPRTRTGEPLEPICARPDSPGAYYVQGTHPDSFDSRYRVNGLDPH